MKKFINFCPQYETWTNIFRFTYSVIWTMFYVLEISNRVIIYFSGNYSEFTNNVFFLQTNHSFNLWRKGQIVGRRTCKDWKQARSIPGFACITFFGSRRETDVLTALALSLSALQRWRPPTSLRSRTWSQLSRCQSHPSSFSPHFSAGHRHFCPDGTLTDPRQVPKCTVAVLLCDTIY